jgi:protein O-GlcNAc transferase
VTLQAGPDPRAILAAAAADHRAGRLDKAEAAYRLVLASQPRNADALHLLGVVAYQRGRSAEAVRLLTDAVAIAPRRADFLNHLGMAHKATGALQDAIAAYRLAVSLDSGSVEATYNLGNALNDAQHFDEAAAAYRRVIELAPRHAEAWNNLGSALNEQGRHDEAREAFERALAFQPRYPEALANLGAKFVEKGDLAAAIRCYEEALAIDPDYAAAATPLLHQYQYACDWENFARLEPKVEAMTSRAIAENRAPAESPFQNVARSQDVELQYHIARVRSADTARRTRQAASVFSHERRGTAKKPLTVGYLSGDLRNHPIAHLCCRLFELHDRSRVRVVVYSTGVDDGSYWRRKIAADCDRFVDIRSLSKVEAARLIHEDGVDILVDLMGYTKGNSFGVFSLRPAPVQVTWLGFPGTSGADFFDYAVVDRIVVPPEHAPFYSEAIAYVRHCYQINDNDEPRAETTPTRAEEGLPDNAVVFCSFNQSYKYEPIMFGAWMRVLRDVPESVLWLMRMNELADPNLRRAAAAAGIESTRLIFSAPVEKPLHIRRLALADLALDTRIYGGHTSSSDALRAGVPVITLRGPVFPSRVASSILTAFGLPELITTTLDDYVALATGLGQDAAARLALRKKVVGLGPTAPLLDTAAFVRDLETLFERMWTRHVAGEAPAPLSVD